MKKYIISACLALITGMPLAQAEEVHMGFWSGQWHCIRKQDSSSVHRFYRYPDHKFFSSENFLLALQNAYAALPNMASPGKKSRLLVCNVRNWSGLGHYEIQGTLHWVANLRNRMNVEIDFDNNVFAIRRGGGGFLNATGVGAIHIRNLTLHVDSDGSANIIGLKNCPGATLENYRCYRNNNAGIALRVDGSSAWNPMKGLNLIGDLRFTGGQGGKWGVETLYTENIRIGTARIWSSKGGGICINNGKYVHIHEVDGEHVSNYGNRTSYAVMRFVNNCTDNLHVGYIHARHSGRALHGHSSPNLSLHVDHVRAIHCAEFGVRLSTGVKTSISKLVIAHGVPSGALSIGGESNHVSVGNIYISEVGGHGVHTASSYTVIHGGIIQRCGATGYTSAGGWGNRVENTHIRWNKNGIRVHGPQRWPWNSRPVVANSWIYGNANHGVLIDERVNRATFQHVGAWGNGWGSRNNAGSNTQVISSIMDFR